MHKWILINQRENRTLCLFAYSPESKMNISPNPHVQIQQSLLTGSVHLCTSLFVWFERCFPSVRQASRRVSSNGAEANIVKMLGGGCESVGMLAWQTCVTLQPVCWLSSNPYTLPDLNTYLSITHMWVWARWSQTHCQAVSPLDKQTLRDSVTSMVFI